jgi:hypothetical protein
METEVREMRARWTVEERIDRRAEWAFVLLTAVYAVVVACLSHVKLLWLDELITLHIARLGSAGAIWNALARGADPNPPVTHLLVHWSRMVFGDHEWAYRLPAMAGYWVGMLALFLFLRRRLSGTWALAGTVLSMCMAAFDYSYESRSYGIFYGLAMLAFLCWSWTVERQGTGNREQKNRDNGSLGLRSGRAQGSSDWGVRAEMQVLRLRRSQKARPPPLRMTATIGICAWMTAAIGLPA